MTMASRSSELAGEKGRKTQTDAKLLLNCETFFFFFVGGVFCDSRALQPDPVV